MDPDTHRTAHEDEGSSGGDAPAAKDTRDHQRPPRGRGALNSPRSLRRSQPCGHPAFRPLASRPERRCILGGVATQSADHHYSRQPGETGETQEGSLGQMLARWPEEGGGAWWRRIPRLHPKCRHSVFDSRTELFSLLTLSAPLTLSTQFKGPALWPSK